uniref:Flocculation protein FLO11-like n=1 Tax=Haemonchus contortus TaxID=6289 RepID=A0A7I4YQE7_HAECO
MSEDEDDSKDSQEKGTSKTSSKSLSSESLGATKSTSKTLSSEGTIQKKTQKTTGAHKGTSKSIAVKTVRKSASLGVRPQRSSDIIPICFTNALYVICLAALVYVIIRYISQRNELEKQIDRIPKK